MKYDICNTKLCPLRIVLYRVCLHSTVWPGWPDYFGGKCPQIGKKGPFLCPSKIWAIFVKNARKNGQPRITFHKSPKKARPAWPKNLFLERFLPNLSNFVAMATVFEKCPKKWPCPTRFFCAAKHSKKPGMGTKARIWSPWLRKLTNTKRKRNQKLSDK